MILSRRPLHLRNDVLKTGDRTRSSEWKWNYQSRRDFWSWSKDIQLARRLAGFFEHFRECFRDEFSLFIEITCCSAWAYSIFIYTIFLPRMCSESDFDRETASALSMTADSRSRARSNLCILNLASLELISLPSWVTVNRFLSNPRVIALKYRRSSQLT